MSNVSSLNLFLTFDCDPADFDSSLKVIGEPGFIHLEKSIPTAIKILNQASEMIEKEIKATFFIRNVSTDSRGRVTPEPWKLHMELWKELIANGHSLGLHPHIDVPLTSESDPNFLELIELMNRDFNSLRLLNEYGRVTRVGGHAYNDLTTSMLRKTEVQVDSSAIPGRKLGHYESCSNWLEVNNDLKIDWSYPNLEIFDHDSIYQLAQLPMTTLQRISQPDHRRYIDFSFESFEDFSFSDFNLVTKVHNVVAISHPSTLLENCYWDHATLKFGTENWLNNFKIVVQRLAGIGIEPEFRLLRHIP